MGTQPNNTVIDGFNQEIKIGDKVIIQNYGNFYVGIVYKITGASLCTRIPDMSGYTLMPNLNSKPIKATKITEEQYEIIFTSWYPNRKISN